MSTKLKSLVSSESNDESSDDYSSKDHQDRSRAKYSEKRKKHKKHKKHKKSKKMKKERCSSDAERNSKSDTCAALESENLIELSVIKRTTRHSVSPAGSKSDKVGKPNAKEVDLLKQISSRWDSSGEGEHSRQTLDSKATRIYRSDDYIDKERLIRQSMSHEQHKSTRTSKSVGNTHNSDNRDREHGHTGHQGHRYENHNSRTFNKHGSNQQYGRDNCHRSNYQASGSRDNEKKSNNCNPGHHIIQTNRDLQGERYNQSTTDKYYTSSRKRGQVNDSPPINRQSNQSLGREISSAQKQDNIEDKNMSKIHIKSEQNSPFDEDQQHTWGKRADNRPKIYKVNNNGKLDNKSAIVGDKPASPIEKEKPNFGLSGKLTEETNKVNGVVIAYSEPPGARKPKRRWRLYPFKGDQALPTLYIHRQSSYLIGRDRKVCDLPVDHPSCSKQHAVLQYRLVPYERVDGTKSQCVRPYIIDLESSNGTFVNNKKIEPKRYLELREKDVLKFGFSSREYVLLHENSKEDNEDDEGYDASPVTKAPNDSTQLSKSETK